MTIAGISLAVAASVLSGGTIATNYRTIMSNRSVLKPRREQVLMAAVLVMATASFFLHPGTAGAAIATLATLPAALFLFGSTHSGLPHQKLNAKIGRMAPDFEATDADGTPFRLSEQGGAPVLLKFFRGVWCPYCVAELDQLDRMADRFARLGVVLVAVSSDHADELARFKARHPWKIRLIPDPELQIHGLYNVQSRNFTPKRGPFRDIAIPTTVLIGRMGIVLWTSQSIDFRVRPQAEDVLDQALRLLPVPQSAQESPRPMRAAG